MITEQGNNCDNRALCSSLGNNAHSILASGEATVQDNAIL
jgi:hypothetical protein